MNADLVILRATWDYIDRLDEFLDWSTRVANLLNPPAVVAWNTDKRYLADLIDAGVPTVPSKFFAPGERVRVPKGEVVVKPAIGAGSVGAQRFTDPAPLASMPPRCRTRATPWSSSPMTPGWRTARRRWSSSAGSSRTPSPRGRCCRPPGQRPVFDPSGTYAEESLTAADPDFELWDVGHAALDAAAARLKISATDLLYARVDVIGGGGRSAAPRAGIGRAVTWLASAGPTHARPSTTQVRGRR